MATKENRLIKNEQKLLRCQDSESEQELLEQASESHLQEVSRRRTEHFQKLQLPQGLLRSQGGRSTASAAVL